MHENIILCKNSCLKKTDKITDIFYDFGKQYSNVEK